MRAEDGCLGGRPARRGEKSTFRYLRRRYDNSLAGRLALQRALIDGLDRKPDANMWGRMCLKQVVDLKETLVFSLP